MSLKARIYIAFIISLGALALGNGIYHWQMPDALRFFCFLALAVPASCLKVTLPGIQYGTMSVLFIFLLGGIVKLNLPETLVIGAVCVAAQSLWHSRFGVRLVQVAFSVATISIAITAADYTFHAIPSFAGPFRPLGRLAIAVTVFFFVNTFPIAVVIALTEGKSLRHVWSSCYLWCFPYYLVGAGLVSVFSFTDGLLDWQTGVMILPVVYIIYRSYQLYLNQLNVERERAAEEHKHALEIAELHKQTVEALELSVTAKARLDTVFRASPVAIVTLDREGKVTGWNAMAEQIFGWSAEEVMGQLLPFATGRSEEIIQGIIARTLQGELISGVEMQQWRKDGTPFEAAIWTATLTHDEANPGILVTVADVSARKRLEEQLRLSQKMEAVGRLAGGVAHDFNNLLTVINGYSSLLIETVSGHKYAVSQAEEILNAGTRAAELVSQLLTFSRRQMIKPRAFEVNQLVRDVERMLTRVVGEHIQLKTSLHPDAGWIHADLNQMEGVLLNLATNARDAMDEGGVLTIETRHVEVTPGGPTPNAGLPIGSYVCLIVRDTGHGMNEETKQRLFEPFYTTKERGRGTGLGLSSVLGGIEQNGGHVVVSSELGTGSECSVYLPRIASPVVPAPDPQTSHQVIRGSETILLVEDEVAVRRMLREALTKAGYRVWEAGNGAEAIELWAHDIDKIDLVVTDLVMPVMSGFRLIEELRKLRPGIKVVCMSGHSEDVLRHQNSSEAAPDLLRKPFLPNVLVGKAREILDHPPGPTPAPPQSRGISGLL